MIFFVFSSKLKCRVYYPNKHKRRKTLVFFRQELFIHTHTLSHMSIPQFTPLELASIPCSYCNGLFEPSQKPFNCRMCKNFMCDECALASKLCLPHAEATAEAEGKKGIYDQCVYAFDDAEFFERKKDIEALFKAYGLQENLVLAVIRKDTLWELTRKCLMAHNDNGGVHTEDSRVMLGKILSSPRGVTRISAAMSVQRSLVQWNRDISRWTQTRTMMDLMGMEKSSHYHPEETNFEGAPFTQTMPHEYMAWNVLKHSMALAPENGAAGGSMFSRPLMAHWLYDGWPLISLSERVVIKAREHNMPVECANCAMKLVGGSYLGNAPLPDKKCGTLGTESWCGKCGLVRWCSAACKSFHMEAHAPVCRPEKGRPVTLHGFSGNRKHLNGLSGDWRGSKKHKSGSALILKVFMKSPYRLAGKPFSGLGPAYVFLAKMPVDVARHLAGYVCWHKTTIIGYKPMQEVLGWRFVCSNNPEDHEPYRQGPVRKRHYIPVKSKSIGFWLGVLPKNVMWGY